MQLSATGQAWIYDVLVAGGVYTGQPKRTNYDLMSTPFVKANCKTLCKILLDRRIVRLSILEEANNALKNLKGYLLLTVFPSDKPSGDYPHIFTVEPTLNDICNFITDFCVDLNLLWDDSTLSVFEKETAISSIELGSALAAKQLFTSQQTATAQPEATKPDATQAAPDATQQPSAGSFSPSVTQRAAPVHNPNGPVNPYKSSGGQASKARGISWDSQGNKYKFAGPMYKIEGVNHKAAKVVPTAYIRPLEAMGQGTTDANANKVFVGSANGYTTCTCYFESHYLADTFLNRLISSGSCPAHIDNLKVVKCAVNKGGYLKADTDLGIKVYIVAAKLNETMDEELESAAEEVKQVVKLTDAYKIEDIDAYQEGFSKE